MVTQTQSNNNSTTAASATAEQQQVLGAEKQQWTDTTVARAGQAQGTPANDSNAGALASEQDAGSFGGDQDTGAVTITTTETDVVVTRYERDADGTERMVVEEVAEMDISVEYGGDAENDAAEDESVAENGSKIEANNKSAAEEQNAEEKTTEGGNDNGSRVSRMKEEEDQESGNLGAGAVAAAEPITNQSRASASASESAAGASPAEINGSYGLRSMLATPAGYASNEQQSAMKGSYASSAQASEQASPAQDNASYGLRSMLATPAGYASNNAGMKTADNGSVASSATTTTTNNESMGLRGLLATPASTQQGGKMKNDSTLSRADKLREIFIAFASFGSHTWETEMGSAHAAKLCRECGLVEEHSMPLGEADVVFAEVAGSVSRKMSYDDFVTKFIPAVASIKGMSSGDVESKIIAHSWPECSGPVPDDVHLHEQKHTYCSVCPAEDEGASQREGLARSESGSQLGGSTAERSSRASATRSTSGEQKKQ